MRWPWKRERKPVGFCSDCPDHEGCMQGYPCTVVKAAAERARADDEDDLPTVDEALRLGWTV